jgi:orotate phosphoribosyltransferase
VIGYNGARTMPVDRKDIERLRDLMQRHCLRYGDFTLVSGRRSKYYYNGKRITLRPSGAKLIGEALVDVVLASGAEAVGGPALGAVPIAMAVGLATLSRGRDLPVFVVRMEQKQYGARDRVAEPYPDEGEELLTAGRRVAIVEDAITTGGSVQKAIDAVEALGCRVVLVAVLVERHEGGGAALRSRGYDVLSIFRTDEDGRLSVNDAFLQRLEAARPGGGAA